MVDLKTDDLPVVVVSLNISQTNLTRTRKILQKTTTNDSSLNNIFLVIGGGVVFVIVLLIIIRYLRRCYKWCRDGSDETESNQEKKSPRIRTNSLRRSSMPVVTQMEFNQRRLSSNPDQQSLLKK